MYDSRLLPFFLLLRLASTATGPLSAVCISEAGWEQYCPITELSTNMLCCDWSVLLICVLHFLSRKWNFSVMFQRYNKKSVVRCNRVGNIYYFTAHNCNKIMSSCINCRWYLTNCDILPVPKKVTWYFVCTCGNMMTIVAVCGCHSCLRYIWL